MSPSLTHRSDVLIIGAGAAGLYCALTASLAGAKVTVVSATPLAQTASYWAQGGIAAALAVDDSTDAHLQDTLVAGRDLVRLSAAELLCQEIPKSIEHLRELGVKFDADRKGVLSLGLEGGHSARRVVHAGGSATGRRLVRQLSALLVKRPGVTIFEKTRATALWTSDGRCVGAVTDKGHKLKARATVLACGGSAALWYRTTNPPGSIGVGAQLAFAAGAPLADIELVQFHPTAVAGIKGREGFLVTEAIRGEGATLHNGKGERFVEELSPRDEVASAIWNVMKLEGSDHVMLDMRKLDLAGFPNVVNALRDAGLDPSKELVPVSPACHYTMGGVAVDLNSETRVRGLFAVGETSCTGLHGANRLASNSLAECIVFGGRAAIAALNTPPLPSKLDKPPTESMVVFPEEETRRSLWQNAGIERETESLSKLLDDPHPIVRAIGASALKRKESRGAHKRTDFPDLDPKLNHTHFIVYPDGEIKSEKWR